MNNIELTFAKETTDKLYDHELAKTFFSKPVDPINDGVIDYLDVISHPMDFGTIKEKLKSDEYKSAEEWKADVMLVWDNAIKYHKDKRNGLYPIAVYFKNKCEKMLALIPKSQADTWFLKVQKANKRITNLLSSSSSPDTIAPRNPQNAIK